MNQVSKFMASSEKLMGFIKKWAKNMEGKCEKSHDDQLKASLYIWARYSMSINTLRYMCRIELLPDLYVIGRCCLEFSASLKAVLSDEKAANDYLKFEIHSKSKYLRHLNKIGETEKAAQLEKHLNDIGVDNTDNYKWNKWCARLGGFSGLIENNKGPTELELYSLFSNFAHGSIIAMQVLQNLQPSPKLLENVVKLVYSDYILSTKSFLDKVWGQIITENSETCKREFCEIAKLNC